MEQAGGPAVLDSEENWSVPCICPLTLAARSDYEQFVQAANRNEDRTLGIQIVGLYPNMPGSSISSPASTRLFNGRTQVSSSNQPVSSLVPWSATDQYTGISFLSVYSCDRLSARKTRKFHELLQSTLLR
jgi:hypothetical protein